MVQAGVVAKFVDPRDGVSVTLVVGCSEHLVSYFQSLLRQAADDSGLEVSFGSTRTIDSPLNTDIPTVLRHEFAAERQRLAAARVATAQLLAER